MSVINNTDDFPPPDDTPSPDNDGGTISFGNSFLLIAIICVVSVILIKKRNKIN